MTNQVARQMPKAATTTQAIQAGGADRGEGFVAAPAEISGAAPRSSSERAFPTS